MVPNPSLPQILHCRRAAAVVPIVQGERWVQLTQCEHELHLRTPLACSKEQIHENRIVEFRH